MRRSWLIEVVLAVAALAVAWICHNESVRADDIARTISAAQANERLAARFEIRQPASETAMDPLRPFGTSGLPAPLAKAVQGRIDGWSRAFKANRAYLDHSYVPLFVKLKLPPQQLERVRDLLAERMCSEDDANEIGLAAGLPLEAAPDRDFIMNVATEDADDALRAELGPEKFGVFETYQLSLRGRLFVVQPFAQTLREGPNALTEDQIAALSESLPRYFEGTDAVVPVGVPPDLTAAFLHAAQSVLTAPQRQAFEGYRVVWTSRQTMVRVGEEQVLKRANARRP